MSPDEFRRSLDLLLEATTQIVLLPLDEMTAYVEEVERRGAGNDAFTEARIETTAHVGRMVSAAQHLVSATALGGRS